MPNIKSAKKRVKVNQKKALINKMNKTALKTIIKKADIALANNADDADVAVKNAVRALDRAVSKGLLHKNTAARKKSQIVLKQNAK